VLSRRPRLRCPRRTLQLPPDVRLTLLTPLLQVIVPLLRTPEEAKALVQSTKFPPVGTRGFGSPLAMERFNPVPTFTEYLQHANDTLLTIVQIETKEALESVEEIAAVPGIDCLFIGPFDLGTALPPKNLFIRGLVCSDTHIG
jgi:2-keto-3-deoxy-L-rhamnonate aldolase RhmA